MLVLLLFLGLTRCSAEFELVVGLAHTNSAGLEDAFWAVSTPSSPNYLKHLSLGDVSALVGADAEDLDSTIDWLRKLGASSVQVSGLRDAVTAQFATQTAWSGSVPSKKTWPQAATFVLRRDPKSQTSPERIHQASGRAARSQAFAESGSYTVPNIKKAYGIPLSLAAKNESTTAMVWGPGSFGYSKIELESFRASQCPGINPDKIKFVTAAHGEPGGDNYGEGNLDVHMISAFGMNATILVDNTNTSASTEEGKKSVDII